VELALALVPPAEFKDGYLRFVISLGFIGLLTAFIGDLASLLGCEIGIPDAITAITFVALGTSLPDTFASKAAAEQDEYADASIGNITGSNSVNVFLGLGTSWMLGSVYWRIQGQTDEWKALYPHIASRLAQSRITRGGLVVESGNLSFCVFVFTCCALACIFALGLRRYLFAGELGGPFIPKVCTVIYFVCLWLGYIGISWFYIHLNGG